MARIDWPAWETIDELAKGMGVRDYARLKWRTRGVPHRYRIPLLDEAERLGKTLSKNDFNAPIHAEAAE